MPDYPFRLCFNNFTIFHFYADRLPAIQAGRIDSNSFPRKEPADRQRFKRSLAEPLLLTVNRDAELILQAVERSQRHNNIGLRI